MLLGEKCKKKRTVSLYLMKKEIQNIADGDAEKDLLELADISTDKQLEDIKSGKLKKKCKKSKVI